MNKAILSCVSDICKQEIRLPQTVLTVNNNDHAKRAQLIADSLRMGLVCWEYKNLKLTIYTSQKFKEFLDYLKPGIEIKNAEEQKFTIQSEPYPENNCMCILSNGCSQPCWTLYNKFIDYKTLIYKKARKLWIARDAHGDLYIYEHKPEKTFRGTQWCDYELLDDKHINGFIAGLDCRLFPELTFENSPQELVLKT